jgi:hypothetical protein
MDVTTSRSTDGGSRRGPLQVTPLVLAALASAGAGLVHGAAAGSHSGDRGLALLFAATAAAQLGWAALALARPARAVALAGTFLNLGALTAWALTRTSAGVPGLPALGADEAVGLQDGACAALALAAVLAGLWAWLAEASPAWLRHAAVAPVAVLAVAALAVPAMAARHAHAHGDDDHGPDAPTEVASPDTSTVAFVDDEVDPPTDRAPGADDTGDAAAPAGEDGHGHGHDGPTGPHGPVISLYDPRVTPEQRAAARDLIERTRVGMERFQTLDDVTAAGYVSIGDGLTGYEHFIHLGHILDGNELDPNAIESIVAQVNPDGSRDIVSAMYLMAPGNTMADVPDIAGELTTWHDHQDLCWEGIRVVGRLGPNGTCPRGEFRGTAPMLHVWLVPHPCGPFAGLEGHGGGCAAHDH